MLSLLKSIAIFCDILSEDIIIMHKYIKQNFIYPLSMVTAETSWENSLFLSVLYKWYIHFIYIYIIYIYIYIYIHIYTPVYIYTFSWLFKAYFFQTFQTDTCQYGSKPN